MSSDLVHVRRAARKIEQGQRELEAALRTARDRGVALRPLAEAAGLTPQGVSYLLDPNRRRRQKKVT